MNREITIKVNDNSDIDIKSEDQFTAHEAMCMAATFIIAAAKIKKVKVSKMKWKIGKYINALSRSIQHD
ncbi:hypothetical protein [Dielma fastidiosa]|uniref:hypothetical protein n=1 Tax=Dielma fastidiosa TaxID=1034346 RepID=UPI0003B6D786|nr:hypothetical protein [Dielma fastidiosa]